jgi:uncharacterized protein (DUF488 family)
MKQSVRIATIGFTQKSAEQFFTMLQKARVKRVLDIRLHNQSQLAGFSKQDDLAYFAKEILGIEYLHLTELAPTQELMDALKKAKGSWTDFEKRFLDLMAKREIERELKREVLSDGCLLCSEDKPHQCHRRLVAEYLKTKWRDVTIEHLV